jgi:hypothetical protein
MTDDLVKRLRSGVPCCDPDAGNGEGSYYVEDADETMHEAADRIEALTAENERLRNDHASAVAELNKTKALLKGYRRGYKNARAALGDTQ